MVAPSLPLSIELVTHHHQTLLTCLLKVADSSKGEMVKTMAAQLGLSSDQLAMLESVLGMVDKKGLGEVAKTDVGQIVR